MGRKRNGATTEKTPMIGDNSNLNDDERRKLNGYISEVERLDAMSREISSDRGLIYKSAKETGFDTKAMKHLVRLRRMERDARDSFENACDVYALALGDFKNTPLGEAMAPRVQA